MDLFPTEGKRKKRPPTDGERGEGGTNPLTTSRNPTPDKKQKEKKNLCIKGKSKKNTRRLPKKKKRYKVVDGRTFLSRKSKKSYQKKKKEESKKVFGGI